MALDDENPFATWVRELGLPAIEDVLPSPEEFAKTLGVPTLLDLSKQIKGKSPIKLPALR